MKFITENGTEDSQKEENFVEIYHRHLKNSSCADLVELAREADAEEAPLCREIRVLALTNAIRIAMKSNDVETCREIVEDAKESEMLEGKLEYFEWMKDSLQGVAIANRMQKREQTILLERRKEKLRRDYGFRTVQMKKRNRVRLSGDMYTMFWTLSQLAENGTIHITDVYVDGMRWGGVDETGDGDRDDIGGDDGVGDRDAMIGDDGIGGADDRDGDNGIGVGDVMASECGNAEEPIESVQTTEPIETIEPSLEDVGNPVESRYDSQQDSKEEAEGRDKRDSTCVASTGGNTLRSTRKAVDSRAKKHGVGSISSGEEWVEKVRSWVVNQKIALKREVMGGSRGAVKKGQRTREPKLSGEFADCVCDVSVFGRESSTLEVASTVLSWFSRVWAGDLDDREEKYSFHDAYLALLDSLPEYKITEEMGEFFGRHFVDGKDAGEAGVQEKGEAQIEKKRKLQRVEMKMAAYMRKRPEHLKKTVETVAFPKRKEGQIGVKKEQKEIEEVLRGYLAGEEGPEDVIEVATSYPFADIEKSAVYLHAIEKAVVRKDADVVLFCVAAPYNPADPVCFKVLGQTKSPRVQSYFLASILNRPEVPLDLKKSVFLEICPIKEMFLYGDVINLLEMSPPETHLQFFAHFIRAKNLLQRRTLYGLDKKKRHMRFHTLVRSVEMVKRYVRAPQKAYLVPLDEIDGLYSKILDVLVHRKEYEIALAIRPFDAEVAVRYIKHLHAGAVGNRIEKKSAVLSVYDACRKIAGVFSMCFCNLEKIGRIELLASVYSETLSVLLALEVPLKNKAHRLLKDMQSTEPEFRLLKRAMEVVRRRIRIWPAETEERGEEGREVETEDKTDPGRVVARRREQRLAMQRKKPGKRRRRNAIEKKPAKAPEYSWLLKYDLWRMAGQGGELSVFQKQVVTYALRRLEQLDTVEFSYLVQIRGARVSEEWWSAAFGERGKACGGDSEKFTVIVQSTKKALYSEYISYLVEKDSEEDLSDVLFTVLKAHKEIDEKEEENVVERMFFDNKEKVVYRFGSWVPNMSIIKRRKYFEYFFKYLEKHNPRLLKEVKSELRKEGFVVE